SPSPSATGLPLPVLPTPTPSVVPPAPVGDLQARVDSMGAIDVRWSAQSGDTSYTAVAAGGGRTSRIDTAATSASFPRMPAGAVVLITVTAHGDVGDAPAATVRVTMPAAVPPVTGARMRSSAAGLVVSWTRPSGVPAGTRYLVALTGTEGGSWSRLVDGASVTVTGLTAGRLYAATVTTVTDSGRSTATAVEPVVWSPPAAPAAPPPAQEAQPGAIPSVAPTVAQRAADVPQPTAQRTLVSSPLAAAGLAGLAVVLGALAIGLLLRRPRDRRP
ncbi:MAG: fibronectin type III domain-containing protein, partial [Amnibacterium sp.]